MQGHFGLAEGWARPPGDVLDCVNIFNQVTAIGEAQMAPAHTRDEAGIDACYGEDYGVPC